MIAIRTLKIYIVTYALMGMLTAQAAAFAWQSHCEDKKIVHELDSAFYYNDIVTFEAKLDEIQNLNTLYNILCDASKYGQTDFVQKLIEHRAPLTIGHYQNTPLHYAAKSGHCKVINLLLAAGANINAQAWPIETPLDSAIKHDQPEAVELLLTSGAEPMEYPLHDAAHHGSVKAARLLIEKYPLIKMLLDHGAENIAEPKKVEQPEPAAAAHANQDDRDEKEPESM